MSELYDTINKLCKEQGVSVSRMCLDLGMTKSIMSELKMGRKKTLSAKTLSKIADYLGVTVSQLIQEEPTKDIMQIRQLFRERPELKILFDAAEDAPASEILNAAAQILRYKEQNDSRG